MKHKQTIIDVLNSYKIIDITIKRRLFRKPLVTFLLEGENKLDNIDILIKINEEGTVIYGTNESR